MAKNSNYPVHCLVFAWVGIVVSYVVAINYGAQWFSRTGSMLVLFSVMAEYALLTGRHDLLIEKIMKRSGIMAGIGNVSPTKKHQNQEKFAHISAILGTFIWGFGDCFVVGYICTIPQ